tara:strand:+ start:2543 stop:2965 length:423 start_codon:yes stop_codon:yes gene_type:complete
MDVLMRAGALQRGSFSIRLNKIVGVTPTILVEMMFVTFRVDPTVPIVVTILTRFGMQIIGGPTIASVIRRQIMLLTRKYNRWGQVYRHALTYAGGFRGRTLLRSLQRGSFTEALQMVDQRAIVRQCTLIRIRNALVLPEV